jgi:hypothetical protein
MTMLACTGHKACKLYFTAVIAPNQQRIYNCINMVFAGDKFVTLCPPNVRLYRQANYKLIF